MGYMCRSVDGTPRGYRAQATCSLRIAFDIGGTVCSCQFDASRQVPGLRGRCLAWLPVRKCNYCGDGKDADGQEHPGPDAVGDV